MPTSRRIWLALVSALVLGLGWPVAMLAQDSLPAPNVTATAVFAFDPATGEVIMARNADDRLAIGSVTKIATAMVAVQYLPLDEQVVVLGDDMVAEGYSAMGLQPGDTLTVEHLLTGLMVESGGDAASALARTAGSQLCGCDDVAAARAAFVEAMNEFATSLGLTNTQFANPDGADDPNAWSSARDVATMFATLIEDPTLAAMGALPSYSLTSAGPEQTLYEGISTNQFVGQYDITSAKTGSETNAGGCIVLARTTPDGGTTEVIAILGADLEYDELWTPIVDARWDDALAVFSAIDAAWTPGQFIAAEPTSPPVAFEPASGAVEDNAPLGDNTGPGEPIVASDTSPVTTGANAGRSSLAPVAVGTVMVSVLALAGVVSWIRPGAPRSAG